MIKERQKEESFEFIRAISTIGIVLFHYSFNFIEYQIGGSHIVFQKFSNGDWGGLFVAIFFMLSGAVLWYNYKEKIQIGKFYVKRWLSIFPMFYIAWFIMYWINVRKLGTRLWGGPKKQILYTVFGMDGYLMHWGMNYYTLGEWFLGAIILLYVLFPIIRILFKNRMLRYLTTVVLVILFTANLYKDWFLISDGKNLITCIMDFWIGMFLVEYKEKLKNRYVALACALASVILMFAPIPIEEIMCSAIVGGLWFIIFMYIAKYVMKPKWVTIVVHTISKYSFGIFLVHHVILYAVMKNFEGGTMSFLVSVFVFIGIFTLTLAVGAVLSLEKYVEKVMFRWIGQIKR
ncbi:MAG: acyltransferase [Lachnospiraceae bacterium]|nr:acyltransferase [Lachnospiraceae bacterium]